MLWARMLAYITGTVRVVESFGMMVARDGVESPTPAFSGIL